MNKLRHIWHALTSRYTDNTALIDELWAEIEKHYSEKKRYYHNLTHLAYLTEKAMHYKDRLTDPDTYYLLDFDLAILGESREIYLDYAKKIRKEYAIYPAFLYKKGRKKVLHHLLALDRIFKTKEFYDQYEQQARENLKAELQGL